MTDRKAITWTTVLNDPLKLLVMINSLPTKGHLVYEYNPFRNYRLCKSMFEYKGCVYSLLDLWLKFGISLKCTAEKETTGEGSTKRHTGNYKISPFTECQCDLFKTNNAYTFGGWIKEAYTKGWEDNLLLALKNAGFKESPWAFIPDGEEAPLLRERGELVDFITEELKFDLKHPVNIVPQYSYDGSVNLVLNDGINTPKLINSRFSATGKNTYEIVDRKGNNDTNIYDQGPQFDIDTSLYKIVTSIPKLEFKGTNSGGNLPVGTYFFYFKLADADGNETDFIAESGQVSVFLGEGSYFSVSTGLKNQNSSKQVRFQLTNIDSAYDYIHVYYSRTTGDLNENSYTEYKKINKNFTKSNTIIITGFEDTEDISAADINLHYNLINSASTATVCQNMLFMANVHKLDIPYKELGDLSLRILPHLHSEVYDVDLDENYIVNSRNKGYIDSKFIYEKTGYWENELYRFGVVYILPNGELTPVFDVRGGTNISETAEFLNIPIYDSKHDDERHYVEYNETNNMILEKSEVTRTKPVFNENIKGVCRFTPDYSEKDKLTNPCVFGVDFEVPSPVIKELRKYVKGLFFVRLARIPMVLCLGITIGIDKVSKTPTIPTMNGILDTIQTNLEKTHVETDDINDINYISEGFLSRYSFYFKRKHTSFWKKLGKIVGIGALIVGAVAGAIFTGGASLAGIGLAGSLMFGAKVAIIGAVVGAAAGTVGGTLVASFLELGYACLRIGKKKTYRGKSTTAPRGYKIVENDLSRTLNAEFPERIIIKDPSHNEVKGILCPDYTLNLPLYNQIFTGNEHTIEQASLQSASINREGLHFFENRDRHFYHNASVYNPIQKTTYSRVIGIPDNVKCTGIDKDMFRSRAGEAEEAWRYECIAEDLTTNDDSNVRKINTDIVRGSFCSYLGINNPTILGPAEIVNIYTPGYDPTKINEYVNIRMNDNSPYQAISDRLDLNEVVIGVFNANDIDARHYLAFRGDCYICQYTLRINRNFNDPSAPYNDDLVDTYSWKNNYNPDNTESYANINLGDVNAVALGMWATFKLRSTNNLNIRTLDNSHADETAMTGHPRGYYPAQPMSTEGVYKTVESEIYNRGFAKNLGDRWNFITPDAPYIKNWFGTRIMYSDIHVNDAFKNGFRVFLGQHYRDYTREYGEIVRLLTLQSNLLCVFEHGVALIPVNERAVAGEGAGGNVYINTSNVLPENPKIISDMYGSQWPESVLKVPGQFGDSVLYVYGVDTVAKKIWRTDGSKLECISDFRVLSFLNNNITLGERELTPIIGIRNVKTVYNAYKRDVMFTFYDNLYGQHEKAWNLCWNELLLKFITFYSWIPSYMENIDNIPFSFDRNTSKYIAKLGIGNVNNSIADGITLTNNVINNKFETISYIEDKNDPNSKVVTCNEILVDNFSFPFSYINKYGKVVTKTATLLPHSRDKFIGVLGISNRMLPANTVPYNVHYERVPDPQGNWKKFTIRPLFFKVDKTVNGEEIDRTITLGEIVDDAKYPDLPINHYGLFFNSGNEEYSPVFSDEGELNNVTTDSGGKVETYEPLYRSEALFSELYYRNKANHAYADFDENKIKLEEDMQLAHISDVEALTKEKYNALKQLEFTPVFEKCNSFMLMSNKTIADISVSEEGIFYGVPEGGYWVRKPKVPERQLSYFNLPIFTDRTGKRVPLDHKDLIKANELVTYLNIRASIQIEQVTDIPKNEYDTFQNMLSTHTKGATLIDLGLYESTVAIAPKRNLQFLSTDFWKHGQSGLIDIADDIYPTYWYGRQHPFEFEVIVVNDPATHKIFTNLELIANKAQPESFHYEVIGDSYDFAKDKPNMYFRLEALKALWLYNGADIEYNSNFLKISPHQLAKSADLIKTYFARLDTINDIEDYYVAATNSSSKDYRHLSGGEITYYPNRQEFRVCNHVKAVSMDDLLDTTEAWNKKYGITNPDSADYTKSNSYSGGRSIIAANCQYLEDRWKILINPLLVCYKNEYSRKDSRFALINPLNSDWVYAYGSKAKLPPLPIYNSPIPDAVKLANQISFPDKDDNALYHLYDLSQFTFEQNWKPLDLTNWLGGNYSETASNRKEVDMKDKFMKVRIRYSGKELAVIDFLNTIYRISYA